VPADSWRGREREGVEFGEARGGQRFVELGWERGKDKQGTMWQGGGGKKFHEKA